MSDKSKEVISKPSFTIGWRKGNAELVLIAIGTVSDTLDAFKAERAKGPESEFQKIAHIRRSRLDKVRVMDRPERVGLSVDLSAFDGKPIPEETLAKIKDNPDGFQAERAAAAVITGDGSSEPEPKESAPEEKEPEESKPDAKGKGRKNKQ